MWQSIASTLYGVGKLWLPHLSLNLMKRDYSLFGHPFDLQKSEVSIGTGPGTFWKLATSITVPFPDWDYDELLEARRMRLYIPLQVKVGIGDSVNVRLNYVTNGNPGNEVNHSNSSYNGYSDLYVDFDFDNGDTLPANSDVSISVQVQSNDNTDQVSIRRIFGAHGPTCRFVWSAT